MASILLRDGQVFDGTGGPSFKGHVLINNDRIEGVIRDGQGVPVSDVVVEAAGCAVSPGFIDMHSHGDWLLPHAEHPDLLTCMLEQGVTTLVGGNCGFSPAPIRKETEGLVEAHSAMLTAKPFAYTWESMAGFLDHLEGNKPVVNIAELVGHASLRYRAADTVRGPMRPDELKRCLKETQRAFDEGACGLSLGLGYDPGMYSPLEEIEAFCAAAKEADRTVTVHLKALSRLSPCYPVYHIQAHNVRALREMLDVARKADVRLQVSHFIFVGRRTWPTADQCIGMIDEARREGMDVMIDAFPYTCGNTTINVILPYWFLAILPDGYTRRRALMRLRAEIEIGFLLVGFSYHDYRVMDVAVPGWEEVNGLTIDQIGRRWNVPSLEAVLRLSRESKGQTLMLLHTYSGDPGNEGPLESVLSHEACLFETDVVLKGSGYPNPAGMGTFPKILGDFVRQRRLFSMENAIHRMTLASAARFGLKDRGVLAAGKSADVVVFDPEGISDTPPLPARPAGRPRGIVHVFMNGTHVVRDGSYIRGVRAGRVLRA